MKKPLVFFLLLNSLLDYAGNSVRVRGHKFLIVPVVGAVWQPTLFGEVEFSHVYDIHYVNRHFGRTILAYSKIGAEFNLNLPKGLPSLKHELWAPKFSSEVELGYFCLRVNVEDYLQPGINKVYITPDAGLTLSGFVTVSCGYNKPFAKRGFEAIRPFRISVNIMLPFVISGSSRYN